MQYNTVSMHLLPQVVHIKKQVDINFISCFSHSDFWKMLRVGGYYSLLI